MNITRRKLNNYLHNVTNSRLPYSKFTDTHSSTYYFINILYQRTASYQKSMFLCFCQIPEQLKRYIILCQIFPESCIIRNTTNSERFMNFAPLVHTSRQCINSSYGIKRMSQTPVVLV